MRTGMAETLEIGHPIPLVQRFAFNRLFGGFSHNF
jgi:hypothetical protein